MPGLPRPRFSLYLSAQLQIGVVRVYSQQCQYLVGKAGNLRGGAQLDSPVCCQAGSLPCPSCPQRTSSTSLSACTVPSSRSALIWWRLTCECARETGTIQTLQEHLPAWLQLISASVLDISHSLPDLACCCPTAWL
jgi:hypothetical protein